MFSGIIEDFEQLTEKEEKLKRLDESKDTNELIEHYLLSIPKKYRIESTRKLIELLKVDSNCEPCAVQFNEVATPCSSQSSTGFLNNQSAVQLDEVATPCNSQSLNNQSDLTLVKSSIKIFVYRCGEDS